MFEHLIANAIQTGADISQCGYQMVFPNRIDYYYNSRENMYLIIIEGLRNYWQEEL